MKYANKALALIANPVPAKTNPIQAIINAGITHKGSVTINQDICRIPANFNTVKMIVANIKRKPKPIEDDSLLI